MDVVPSQVRKRTLDEIDDNEGLGYADDAYASEDAGAVNSNGGYSLPSRHGFALRKTHYHHHFHHEGPALFDCLLTLFYLMQ